MVPGSFMPDLGGRSYAFGIRQSLFAIQRAAFVSVVEVCGNSDVPAQGRKAALFDASIDCDRSKRGCLDCASLDMTV
jgi:hypothetical protein